MIPWRLVLFCARPSYRYIMMLFLHHRNAKWKKKLIDSV